MTSSTRGEKRAADAANGLDPPDAFRLWLRFLRLDQRLRTVMGRCLREIGLSIPQFDVLSALSDHAGITQVDLAQRLFVTKGNVSGLIDRLVDTGLVERRRGAPDRRSHALFLTEKGRRLAIAGLDRQKALLATTLGRLTPDELGSLHRLLGRWRDILREFDAYETAGPSRRRGAD